MLDLAGQHASEVMTLVNGNAAAHSEIVASWRRCVSLHKMTPERDMRTQVLTEGELRQAIEPIEEYVHIAGPAFHSLAKHVAKAGFFLSFADANGTALMHLGAVPDSGDMTSKTCDGMMWRENLQGTNAIGTGLFLSRPTAIHMNEHFLASNTPLTCLVAPLYDPFGRILGAINIATASSDYERSLTSVLLGTLVSTSQHIESRLFQNAYPKALIVSLPNAGGPHGSTPLIAVNRDFEVVGATHAIRCSHSLTDEQLNEGVSIGKIYPDMGMENVSLDEAERITLERALNSADNCVSLAANRLGISRATMHRKMRVHSILRKQRGKGGNVQ